LTSATDPAEIRVLTETVILQQGSINRHCRLGALRDGDGHEQYVTRRVAGYIDAPNATFLGEGVGNDAALFVTGTAQGGRKLGALTAARRKEYRSALKPLTVLQVDLL